MRLRSMVARRLIAGLCIAAVVCIAISPAALGQLYAVLVPVFSSTEPRPASVPLEPQAVPSQARGGLSATGARAPPTA